MDNFQIMVSEANLGVPVFQTISQLHCIYPQLKRLACNRRDLSSSLLHPYYADAHTHTQHNKKVDQPQNGKVKQNHIS